MAGVPTTAGGFLGPDWKVSAPGITTGPSATITETGIRLQATGSLALYTMGATEAVGLVCCHCRGLALNIRPWARCQNCGEYLLEILPPIQPPRAFSVNYATGLLTEDKPARFTPPAFTCTTAGPEPPSASPDRKEPADIPPPYTAERPNVTETSRSRGRGRPGRIQTESAPKEETVIIRLTPGPGKPTHTGKPTVKAETVPTVTVPPLTNSATTTVTTTAIVTRPTTLTRNAPLQATSRDIPRVREAFHTDSEDWDEDSEGEQVWVLQTTDTRGLTSCAELDFGDPESDPEEISVDSIVHGISCSTLDWPASRSTGRSATTDQQIERSPDSAVLPGYGNPKELPKLSRLQRIVQKRVAKEYGLQYPYVPPTVLQEIECLRKGWYADAIWDFLKVPESLRQPGLSPHTDQQMEGCLLTWGYGRHIHADRVVFKRPGFKEVSYQVTTIKNGRSVTLPDPSYYW